ncbi:hypothetical protein T01_13212 [Trichinella spiralis]|uniref:Uncharacterized protein n=1 Tax=Trichinella spiralis TaxID=6334 RepID=A0A0V0YW74_TRISP|nr:hypothetical protein T01_13212 [Trichinella spiralis]
MYYLKRVGMKNMNGTEDYGYKRECLGCEKRSPGHISVVHDTEYYCIF